MDSLLKGECTMKCRAEYENELAKTRDQRMKWWRDARYGMFAHYGIYSVYGKHEWAMACHQHLKEQLPSSLQKEIDKLEKK